MTKKKKSIFDDSKLSSSLTLMGATGGIGAMLLGGMSKMFGLNDEKTPQKLAEEMMAGAVRGILEHFEFKLDDLKRDVEMKSEEIGKLKEKLEQYEDKEKSSKTTGKKKP